MAGRKSTRKAREKKQVHVAGSFEGLAGADTFRLAANEDINGLLCVLAGLDFYMGARVGAWRICQQGSPRF